MPPVPEGRPQNNEALAPETLISVPEMLISVITPTFRREDLLARCVESVLSQQVEGACIEHVVVNDAGEPLAPAPWMGDPRVRVVETRRTERAVARNTGAALSRGHWLYFLDDDDYALPGAFQAMTDAARAGGPDAIHLHGAYRVVNEKLNTSDVISAEVTGDTFPLMFSGEIIPLQASWIRRDAFFTAGCFDPIFKAAEDNDLFRRIGFLGPSIRTESCISVIRAEHRTTTSHWQRQQEFMSLGMDKSMSLPGVVGRLIRATRRRPYWRGRCVREYIASAKRALSHGRAWLVISRIFTSLRLSLPCLLAPDFWRGLRRAPQ